MKPSPCFGKSLGILALIIMCCGNAISQNESSKWYFGNHAGLDFMSGSPVVLTNGQLSTTEGCSSVADASGNLLFYTDGITVWNSAHVPMANGTGLMGDPSSTESAVIVKLPGSTNIYYIFTQSYLDGTRYSIVDMTLAAGMGSVTTLNTLLFLTATEKLTSAKHCNNVDTWVITHENNNSNFRSYLVSSTGVGTAVISVCGPTNVAGIGYLKASPNAQKLGIATESPGTGYSIYDFDNTTGTVSNAVVLTNTVTYAYGCEFSPDGTKFYGSTELGPGNGPTIFQWDLSAGSSAAIIASQTIVAVDASAPELGAMQLASNGKIYVARYSTQYLGVINSPNNYGTSCNYVPLGQTLAPNSSLLGLPNIVANSVKPSPGPITYSANCATVTFSMPTMAGAGQSVTQILWNFGQPSSGASNTSTLTNPTHNYTSTGNYTVELIVTYACGSDTIHQVLNLNGAPSLSVTGTFTVCKGQVAKFTASGANFYTWSGGLQNATFTVVPTASTVYTVTGTSTLTGCSSSRTVGLTYFLCAGVEDEGSLLSYRIFPNPASNNLKVELNSEAELLFYDVLGNKVQKEKLQSGIHEINISALSTGIYTIRLKSGSKESQTRFMKN